MRRGRVFLFGPRDGPVRHPWVMTTYAYDPSTATLFAVWEAGLGCTARPVTRLHARTPERLGLRLARR